MLSLMLDTNICIYVMQGKRFELLERFNAETGQMCISAITLAELQYGAEKSARRDENLRAIVHFSDRLEILPFSADAAVHYGQIRVDLERGGNQIGGNDLLIGAHARSANLTLITNNRREFDRIAGLRIENWLAPGG